jgi:hypothetical protein
LHVHHSKTQAEAGLRGDWQVLITTAGKLLDWQTTDKFFKEATQLQYAGESVQE